MNETFTGYAREVEKRTTSTGKDYFSIVLLNEQNAQEYRVSYWKEPAPVKDARYEFQIFENKGFLNLKEFREFDESKPREVKKDVKKSIVPANKYVPENTKDSQKEIRIKLLDVASNIMRIKYNTNIPNSSLTEEAIAIADELENWVDR